MQHKFDLKEGTTRKCPGGYRTLVTPELMALAVIELKEGGVREPHWHPNADELTYCAEGKAFITLFSPGNAHSTFTLSAGEVVYFPKGYLHHIENIHKGKSRFILAYNHAHPEDFNLSSSFGSMSLHALAKTLDAEETALQPLKKQAKDIFISKRKTLAKTPSISSTHKFDLERTPPQIDTPGGLARTLTSQNFPALNHLALFSLRMKKNGIREPHWHPNAVELNLVLKGKARITILSPDGKIDTFTVKEGQGSIIPAGYFHNIENIGPAELHMTVYFNHSAPEDIGLSGAWSAYSKEVLASLFPLSRFPHFLPFREDRMIVTGRG